MKVAVYTIALNEEKFVESWYKSAKDADYLLIGDTGSTDGTIEKAKKLGINVININVSPWRFDVARNTCLSMLPKDVDYCIALDMDEVLVGDWKKDLKKALKDGVTRPRYKYTWSWKDKERTKPDLQYYGDKIHLRKNYRWKHPVHEVIVPDRIEEKYGFYEFEIKHYPDPTKSRGQYLDLLELAVKEDPYNDRNAHYYARELFFYNRKQEAIVEFKRHLNLPTSTWKPERAASMRWLGKCHEGREREEWFLKAHFECPDYREPLLDLALFYYENRRWEECLLYSIKTLKIKEKTLNYLVEDTAWGYIPYDLAGISCYHLEMYDKAVGYGEMAVKMEPDDLRLRANLELYLSKRV